MEIKILLLLAMIFLHIVDDYYCQGILANLKQKSWWEKNAPDEMYKHDYIVALLTHGFSWSFMVMSVPIVYTLICENSLAMCFITFVINVFCHAVVDDIKANRREINLVQDQLIHIYHVIIAWLFNIVI